MQKRERKRAKEGEAKNGSRTGNRTRGAWVKTRNVANYTIRDPSNLLISFIPISWMRSNTNPFQDRLDDEKPLRTLSHCKEKEE